MTTLTPREVDALHFAVRADRQARSHTRIVSAVEEIVAAHVAEVEAEHDRLRLRIEGLALLWQCMAEGSASSAAAREGLSDAKGLSDYSEAMTRRVRDLRAALGGAS